MTSINKPNVRMIKGIEKKVMIGRINAFKSANTIAVMMAVPTPLTLTPRNKAPNMRTPAAFTNSFMKIYKLDY
jgi:hypothetical protein